jgi:predicted nucleic acid-binding protein
MSVFVVDVSGAIKWFIPEVHSDAAQRLCASQHELHVPDFFDLEFANVLWKKIRRGELTRLEADAILAQLDSLPLVRHPDRPLLATAFDVADQTQRTVYDATYLTLAMQLNGRVATADRRLVNALNATAWASFVSWIEDVP